MKLEPRFVGIFVFAVHCLALDTAVAVGLLSVGGSYPTQVALIPDRNACGVVTVQDNVTTVTHAPGAHTLSLTHASNTYPGTVDDAGGFATTPKTLTFGSTQYTLTISGKFTTTGFHATVQVDVKQPVAPQTCSYVVDWVGTKQGDPSTLLAATDVRAFTSQTSATNITGLWQGTIDTGQRRIEIVLDLHVAGDAASGALTLPAAALTFPLQNVTIVGGAFHFDFQADQASFDGHLQPDGKLAGTWLQRGMRAPLTFERIAEMPVLGRKQTPRPPFPYRVENVTIHNDHANVSLAGTLTIPRGEGPFSCAILLTVAGPDDRDQTHSGHKPFFVLADYLTRQGIAVLRTDDRGVGGSTGKLLDASYEDLADDVFSEIKFLKGRLEIRSDRIGVIGNSEGGAIGPLTAAKSNDIHFVVMLAGPGIDVKSALLVQAELLAKEHGMSAQQTQELIDRTNAVARILAEEPENDKAETRLREVLRGVDVAALRTYAFVPSDLEGLVKFYVSRWYRSQLAYDPAPVLARVRAPVLAMTGSLDRVLPADTHLPGIVRALTAGGNADFTVMKVPELNHLFQTARTGSVAEYAALDESFSPVALGLIARWVLEKTR